MPARRTGDVVVSDRLVSPQSPNQHHTYSTCIVTERNDHPNSIVDVQRAACPLWKIIKSRSTPPEISIHYPVEFPTVTKFKSSTPTVLSNYPS